MTFLNNENVRQIFPLNKSKIFSHEEALELLPLLKHISSKTKRELNLLNSQLTFVKSESDKAKILKDKIENELNLWSEKVKRLGTIPVSLCKVKIPSETGYFLWEYPENKLFMH